jgi:hypothetical protein
MGALMTKCQKTKSEIYKGIQMDRSTFHKLPVFVARTLCPICQFQHEWFARAAWDQEPKAQGEQPINLARINRRRRTVAMHQPKWIVIAAIFAAAGVAVGFVAGTTVVDASPVSNSAIRSAVSSSTVAAKSTTYATTFPETNRATKGNRLHVPIPDNQVGAAIEQATKDWDRRSVQSRAPREGERKPLVHCEPVGSPLAGPAILYMSPRRCFAGIGTPPEYTLVDSGDRAEHVDRYSLIPMA